MKEQTFIITDMFCEQCENTINKTLLNIDGVSYAKASLENGNVVIIYDEKKCNAEIIKNAIEKKGYTINETQNINNTINGISILVIIFGLYYIFHHFGLTSIFQNFPEATSQMGYIALFLIGLLTSFHCIAMCGGLNLASSLNNKKILKSTILYNTGRLLSYTLIGGILGLVGSIFTITLKFRAIIGILAGIVMLFMGIKIMNCFPFLKKIYIPTPKFLKKKLLRKNNNGPLYIGLINGFMPCGPLQTMQLLAIASGSFIKGSLSMFSFCLGTIPLLFLFGIFAGTLKNKYKNIMSLVGGTLIIIFGIFMLQNNFALTGINTNISNNADYIVATQQDDVQIINSKLKPGSYDSICVQANVPVEWNITATKDSLNGCNNEIIIPEYNITIKLKEGINTIKFTPTDEGIFSYSCWMGMIKAQIKVE